MIGCERSPLQALQTPVLVEVSFIRFQNSMPLPMLCLSLACLHNISFPFLTLPFNLGPANIPLLQGAFPEGHSPHHSLVSELVSGLGWVLSQVTKFSGSDGQGLTHLPGNDTISLYSTECKVTCSMHPLTGVTYLHLFPHCLQRQGGVSGILTGPGIMHLSG